MALALHVSYLCLLSLIKGASAQGRMCDVDIIQGRNADNQFQTPPPSCAPGDYTGINTYPEGTPLTISWTSTIDPVNLAIVQENAAQPLLFLKCMCSWQC